MRPHARLRLPDGREVVAPTGAILGRLASAQVRVVDPRISEAHALVSLRGRSLKLLALRGWLLLEGRQVSSLDLEPGQRIGMAEGFVMEVLSVELPESVLALELTPASGGLPITHELSSSVYSVVARPPGLEPGLQIDAPARVFSTSETWMLQLAASEPAEIQPGDRWEIAGWRLLALSIPARQVGAPSTVNRGRPHPPMQILTRHDTVHLHAEGQPPLVLSGRPARIVCELASMGAPAPWEVVAGEIWPDTDDRDLLRQSWDRSLRRLRASLKEAGLRDDLVRPDRTGNVELFLLPSDTLIDEQ